MNFTPTNVFPSSGALNIDPSLLITSMAVTLMFLNTAVSFKPNVSFVSGTGAGAGAGEFYVCVVPDVVLLEPLSGVSVPLPDATASMTKHKIIEISMSELNIFFIVFPPKK